MFGTKLSHVVIIVLCYIFLIWISVTIGLWIMGAEGDTTLVQLFCTQIKAVLFKLTRVW